MERHPDGDGCDCTDLDLALIDLTHVPRECDDAVAHMALDMPIACGIEYVAQAPARAPPRSIDPDPGGPRRLCALRTTILLI